MAVPDSHLLSHGRARLSPMISWPCQTLTYDLMAVPDSHLLSHGRARLTYDLMAVPDPGEYLPVVTDQLASSGDQGGAETTDWGEKW